MFYISESWRLLEFFELLRESLDIHRFPTVHLVKTYFLLDNLWISEPSLSKLEKLQCRLVLLDMKYNCAVLLLYGQLYSLFIFFLQMYFLIDHYCKTSNRNLWNLRKSQVCLMFLQGDEGRVMMYLEIAWGLLYF